MDKPYSEACERNKDPILVVLRNAFADRTKVLEIGNSDPRDRCVYSDIDMIAEPGVAHFSHRDGTPYPVAG